MRRIDMAVRNGQVSVYAAHLWTLLEQGCRSKKELAKWMKRSERSIQRYLDELRKAGFAEVVGYVPYATCPQDDDKDVPIDVTDQSIKEIDHKTSMVTNLTTDVPREIINLAERLCKGVFADPTAVDNLAHRLWQVLRGRESDVEIMGSDGWYESIRKYAVLALIEFENVKDRRKRNLPPIRDVYAYFVGMLGRAYMQAA